MSKVLYAYSRNKDFDTSTNHKLLKICDELTPDNISSPVRHKTFVEKKNAFTVSLDKNVILVSKLNLLAGTLYENKGIDWFTPELHYPDGNYAIFRNNDQVVEVLSDSVASRTIWYYHDDEQFIAATSQKAIILFLGSFEFDKGVIPWMLSTGSLGPELSWDKRLKRLQPHSSILLDKKSWNLTVNQNQANFSEQKRTRAQHKITLVNTIRKTIKHLESLDYSHWILPLSGGYDSRAILCFIEDEMGIPTNLRTVTWGLEESITEKGNDAKIAKDLAHSLHVKHTYYHTDISSEPVEVIVDRFLLCSEGRIDHIAGYMDGMEIWRRFHDEGIAGVIRGDEGFGWSQVSSDLTVKLNVACALCSDFENLKHVCEDFGLPKQELPANYKQRETESFSTWRDRLYHTYRIPTILAALSDIKFSYVEQINPLLSASLIEAVRTMPDHLRTDKALFKEIINEVSPEIPYAHKEATAKPNEILRNEPFIHLLKQELNGNYAKELLGIRFIKFVLDGIQEKDTKSSGSLRKSIEDRIKPILPKFLKNWMIDKGIRPKVDGNVLAFRVLIVIRMHKMLTDDSMKFSS